MDSVHTNADGCRALLSATLHERGSLLEGERPLESSDAPYSVEYELGRDGPGSSEWRITAERRL